MGRRSRLLQGLAATPIQVLERRNLLQGRVPMSSGGLASVVSWLLNVTSSRLLQARAVSAA